MTFTFCSLQQAAQPRRKGYCADISDKKARQICKQEWTQKQAVWQRDCVRQHPTVREATALLDYLDKILPLRQGDYAPLQRKDGGRLLGVAPPSMFWASPMKNASSLKDLKKLRDHLEQILYDYRVATTPRKEKDQFLFMSFDTVRPTFQDAQGSLRHFNREFERTQKQIKILLQQPKRGAKPDLESIKI
jgi:hypothetical protein